jgi:hypothetical protein
MRLQLILPKGEPNEIDEPTACVYADCGRKKVQMHQPITKVLRDTTHKQIEVHRYLCVECGRTFRVYPKGVSKDQQISDRVKGLAVMLYLLGLSYGAVALAMESLGVRMSKTEVYSTVQAAARRLPDLKREQVFAQKR